MKSTKKIGALSRLGSVLGISLSFLFIPLLHNLLNLLKLLVEFLFVIFAIGVFRFGQTAAVHVLEYRMKNIPVKMAVRYLLSVLESGFGQRFPLRHVIAVVFFVFKVKAVHGAFAGLAQVHFCHVGLVIRIVRHFFKTKILNIFS